MHCVVPPCKWLVSEGCPCGHWGQNDYDLVDETILCAGEWTKVKPGVYHQFECLEDCIAFEVYWAEFNHNDIVRETVGH